MPASRMTPSSTWTRRDPSSSASGSPLPRSTTSTCTTSWNHCPRRRRSDDRPSNWLRTRTAASTSRVCYAIKWELSLAVCQMKTHSEAIIHFFKTKSVLQIMDYCNVEFENYVLEIILKIFYLPFSSSFLPHAKKHQMKYINKANKIKIWNQRKQQQQIITMCNM